MSRGFPFKNAVDRQTEGDSADFRGASLGAEDFHGQPAARRPRQGGQAPARLELCCVAGAALRPRGLRCGGGGGGAGRGWGLWGEGSHDGSPKYGEGNQEEVSNQKRCTMWVMAFTCNRASVGLAAFHVLYMDGQTICNFYTWF